MVKKLKFDTTEKQKNDINLNKKLFTTLQQENDSERKCKVIEMREKALKCE